MIIAHVQFTVGIALYFISPMVINMGDAMKDATTRLYAIEHPIMMVIAIVLLTMARSKTKNLSDVSAHKRIYSFCISFSSHCFAHPLGSVVSIIWGLFNQRC